jgi:hypothetical protein
MIGTRIGFSFSVAFSGCQGKGRREKAPESAAAAGRKQEVSKVILFHSKKFVGDQKIIVKGF